MRPLIIGHRGAPGYLPEHTRSSYLLALQTGVDAVEPDIVATGDGILVVRHENEISGTTDVADRPEFADRRTTKTIDGQTLSGWFTEDFTWAELATLRCRERLPELRPASAAHDGAEPMLRLVDLLALLDEAAEGGRPVGVTIEVKHATYFSALGLDLVPLLLRDLAASGWDAAGSALVVESFEESALTRLRSAGLRATYIYLMEDAGTAADIVATPDAPTYAEQRMPDGLDDLATRVDGISVDRSVILVADPDGVVRRPSDIVALAHARGLQVFTWTCRAENAALLPQFRRGDDPSAYGDFRSEWTILRNAGVDGVFVDQPDLGLDVFRN